VKTEKTKKTEETEKINLPAINFRIAVYEKSNPNAAKDYKKIEALKKIFEIGISHDRRRWTAPMKAALIWGVRQNIITLTEVYQLGYTAEEYVEMVRLDKEGGIKSLRQGTLDKTLKRRRSATPKPSGPGG
jgi:hypothetical protein